MHQARKRELVWQAVGWLCYLLGVLVFLWAAVAAYLSVPTRSFAGIDVLEMSGLLAGLGLIVLGRYVTFTYGGATAVFAGQVGMMREQHPEKTRLEELGYHIPPESKETSGSGYTYEDGEVRLVCEECGEANDSDFEFCRHCSARLPE